MIKYEIIPTSSFKSDFKTCSKRRYKMDLLYEVIDNLSKGIKLEPKYRDHALSGQYDSFRECHILPDWLLIYKIKNNTLYLYRLGTHSDLF